MMVFILGLLLAHLSICIAFGQHPIVSSSSGSIIGHRAPNRTDTFEFLGIKYGQAPVGELRFAAPLRYSAPTSQVFNASKFNPDCPSNKPPVTSFPDFTGNGFAIYSKFTAQNNNTQDEDCLALNIWTKSPRHLKRKNKPVFVFFHGGRFTIPGPNSPFYKGQNFAGMEDVVVVTVSYRLGILGFSGAPGQEQNAALRDQRLAVEWIRDNISNFGGSPDHIIIFGQSAGGTSVDYWTYAYRHDPIIAGAISHSGTAFSFLPNDPTYSTSLYHNVSSTLSCGTPPTTSPTTILSCLRSAPLTRLLAAARLVPALPSPALSQAPFHPTIDHTLIFPLSTYTNRSLTASFAPTPYLAGSTSNETGFYRVSASTANVSLSNPAWHKFNHRAFTCPTKYAADARARARVPVWRYRYTPDWPNLRLYPATTNVSAAGAGKGGGGRPGSGAYHGSELSLLFGTTREVAGEENGAEQDRLGRYIMGAWAAFGRDPGRGLEGYGWPMWTGGQGEELVLLGEGNGDRAEFVGAGRFDGECPPVEENDPLPGRGAF
ncbi:Alpha/Beta hydrolase protein [Elsinoe ampelina]|uniref:Carboxylic ester hydrolase n=1 Tax=Elsinoe ampelina TaxID=302913 RepID=A0A6A6G515_9PEZI|nr:Alpha/Beta hydrolase protein [Elsinoe ampelina]